MAQTRWLPLGKLTSDTIPHLPLQHAFNPPHGPKQLMHKLSPLPLRLRLLPKYLIPPLHSSPISPSSPSLLQLPSLLFHTTIYILRLSRIVVDFSGSVINPILILFLTASLSGVKAPICSFDAGRFESTATVGGDWER